MKKIRLGWRCILSWEERDIMERKLEALGPFPSSPLRSPVILIFLTSISSYLEKGDAHPSSRTLLRTKWNHLWEGTGHRPGLAHNRCSCWLHPTLNFLNSLGYVSTGEIWNQTLLSLHILHLASGDNRTSHSSGFFHHCVRVHHKVCGEEILFPILILWVISLH